MLCKVVESFSKALLFHEKRNKYVSKQVAIMLRLLESNVVKNEANSNSVNTNTLVSSNLNVNNNGTNNNTGTSNFDGGKVANEKTMYRDYCIMDMMLQQSSLANELRTLFHGLIGGHSINLTINAVLSLNVRLLEQFDTENDIKGHHTLLTIADYDNLHRIITSLDVSAGAYSNPTNKLLNNTSPLIQNMIKVCDPTISFMNLSIVLQEPLFEVINVAKKLQYWSLGKLIPTITMKSIYRIHPLAPTSNVSSAAKVFSSSFLTKFMINETATNKKTVDSITDLRLSLTYILSLFNGYSKVESIATLVPEQVQLHLTDIIVWLLRWNFLVDCTTHLIVDPYKTSSFNEEYYDKDFDDLVKENLKLLSNSIIEVRSNIFDKSMADNTFRLLYSKLSLNEIIIEGNYINEEISLEASNCLLKAIVL